jgi:hypothetical protein
MLLICCYNNLTMKRLIGDVILLISVLVFPWWVSILLLLIGIFIFNNFYEFIVFNVIINSLYVIPSDRLLSNPLFFSLTIVVAYILIQILKSNIILYKNKSHNEISY